MRFYFLGAIFILVLEDALKDVLHLFRHLQERVVGTLEVNSSLVRAFKLLSDIFGRPGVNVVLVSYFSREVEALL